MSQDYILSDEQLKNIFVGCGYEQYAQELEQWQQQDVLCIYPLKQKQKYRKLEQEINGSNELKFSQNQKQQELQVDEVLGSNFDNQSGKAQNKSKQLQCSYANFQENANTNQKDFEYEVNIEKSQHQKFKFTNKQNIVHQSQHTQYSQVEDGGFQQGRKSQQSSLNNQQKNFSAVQQQSILGNNDDKFTYQEEASNYRRQQQNNCKNKQVTDNYKATRSHFLIGNESRQIASINEVIANGVKLFKGKSGKQYQDSNLDLGNYQQGQDQIKDQLQGNKQQNRNDKGNMIDQNIQQFVQQSLQDSQRQRTFVNNRPNCQKQLNNFAQFAFDNSKGILNTRNDKNNCNIDNSSYSAQSLASHQNTYTQRSLLTQENLSLQKGINESRQQEWGKNRLKKWIRQRPIPQDSLKVQEKQNYDDNKYKQLQTYSQIFTGSYPQEFVGKYEQALQKRLRQSGSSFSNSQNSYDFLQNSYDINTNKSDSLYGNKNALLKRQNNKTRTINSSSENQFQINSYSSLNNTKNRALQGVKGKNLIKKLQQQEATNSNNDTNAVFNLFSKSNSINLNNYNMYD